MTLIPSHAWHNMYNVVLLFTSCCTFSVYTSNASAYRKRTCMYITVRGFFLLSFLFILFLFQFYFFCHGGTLNIFSDSNTIWETFITLFYKVSWPLGVGLCQQLVWSDYSPIGFYYSAQWKKHLNNSLFKAKWRCINTFRSNLLNSESYVWLVLPRDHTLSRFLNLILLQGCWGGGVCKVYIHIIFLCTLIFLEI
jgi:hypothetical protein